jgi:catalase (peroxidase I)
LWTNDYFNSLFDLDWILSQGPGGQIQWAPESKDGGGVPPIVMLTSDIAFTVDPIYKPISKGYAADIESLEHDFGHVWYRLMTSDMGPWDRCVSTNDLKQVFLSMRISLTFCQFSITDDFKLVVDWRRRPSSSGVSAHVAHGT